MLKTIQIMMITLLVSKLKRVESLVIEDKMENTFNIIKKMEYFKLYKYYFYSILCLSQLILLSFFWYYLSKHGDK